MQRLAGFEGAADGIDPETAWFDVHQREEIPWSSAKHGDCRRAGS